MPHRMITFPIEFVPQSARRFDETQEFHCVNPVSMAYVFSVSIEMLPFILYKLAGQENIQLAGDKVNWKEYDCHKCSLRVFAQ